ncbi:regulator [Shigella flexneri]|uniref:regulator n=1 Tax=Shigella flexneri TaxID=623 RepID=UPI001F115965|nr:regulator [Shigella flexneri]UMU58179.1 regulator [Shigella flexneri]UMU71399.1 regulator [Shigella flexneri]
MVTTVWKESKGTAKSRYKARRAELIAERRSNEALARKIALKLSGCVRADKAASLGSLRCKKAEEVERKQNRIYYSKPRSEMGVTCSGRQKQRGKSIPAYYD